MSRSAEPSGVGRFRLVGGALGRALATADAIEVDGAVGELRVVETTVAPDEVVSARLVLERAAGADITARGSITARWTAPCRRCGDEIAGRADVTVSELFQSEPVDGETWPLGDDEVDLAPMVRELVMLELPFAPEGELIGGGCVDCGRTAAELADLVGDGDPDEPEPVDRPVVDPRWAALDALDLPDEDDDTGPRRG